MVRRWLTVAGTDRRAPEFGDRSPQRLRLFTTEDWRRRSACSSASRSASRSVRATTSVRVRVATSSAAARRRCSWASCRWRSRSSASWRRSSTSVATRSSSRVPAQPGDADVVHQFGTAAAASRRESRHRRPRCAERPRLLHAAGVALAEGSDRRQAPVTGACALLPPPRCMRRTRGPSAGGRAAFGGPGGTSCGTIEATVRPRRCAHADPEALVDEVDPGRWRPRLRPPAGSAAATAWPPEAVRRRPLVLSDGHHHAGSRPAVRAAARRRGGEEPLVLVQAVLHRRREDGHVSGEGGDEAWRYVRR